MVLLVLASLFGRPPLAHAGKLRKVWEVDLRKMVHATNGLPGFPVFALRFSPDGRKVAVIADIYNALDGRKSRLLVIDLARPSADVRQFEVGFGILENEHGRGPTLNFGWGPSSEIVYAVGKVIHLADGTTCDLPNQSAFISDDVAMSTQSVPPAGIPTSTHIRFYSQSCEERGQWDVSESWLISDVSTDRVLLSVEREISSDVLGERLIVDPLRRKILHRWPENGGGVWEFADGGTAVCQGGAGLNVNGSPAICRNVDTSKEIGETVRNGDEPIATASRASRAVVSDYRSRNIPLDYEYHTVFKGRYVWDFRTGQELASWYPESETYPSVFSPPKQVTEPFRFAISPDGQCVAEGGNGKVMLYKIEP
jgi:hypothetical protein